MLQLRPSCEHCDKSLSAAATDAMICSFECTFCQSCVENILNNVCPNCGGGFSSRPIRPKEEYQTGVSLKQYPASSEKVFKPIDTSEHLAFAESIKDIPPENR